MREAEHGHDIIRPSKPTTILHCNRSHSFPLPQCKHGVNGPTDPPVPALTTAEAPSREVDVQAVQDAWLHAPSLR